MVAIYPMFYALLVDVTVLVHFGFIVFVLFGGFLLFYRRGIAWVHVPAAIYGVAVEWGGWLCPLTPLENYFRALAGEAGYAGGFIAHYLLPIIYPAGLDRQLQWLLGGIVLVLNLIIYAWVFWYSAKTNKSDGVH